MSNKKNSISRRNFIKKTSTSIAAISALPFLETCETPKNPPMKTHRILGKTGIKASLLGFGGGSQFMKNGEEEWQPLLERAIESGVNIFDTCWDYGGGESEIRYGKVLNKYRDKIHIMTKIDERGAEGARKQFEGSLERLQMDYVDILLMHQINKTDDYSVIENGVYKEMLKLKEEGLVKHIGFSTMKESDHPLATNILENLDIDVVFGIINPVKRFGNTKPLLPLIKEKNIGFIAMKTVRGIVSGETTAKELIPYALDTESVASAIIGHHGVDKLEENIGIINEYEASKDKKQDYSNLEKRMNEYYANHTPVWALDGYHDGMMV
ncbi:MAG: aldo/keto reductase [Bacteroidota bacterium]